MGTPDTRDEALLSVQRDQLAWDYPDFVGSDEQPAEESKELFQGRRTAQMAWTFLNHPKARAGWHMALMEVLRALANRK